MLRKFLLVSSYDDPYLIYLFVNKLIRRHYFENLDDGLTNIWTQLKKFLQWSYFIPKALSFLHQFHHFPDEYLCGSSCFKTSGSQSGINSWSAIQQNSRSTKYLELTIKDKSWHIHDIFEPVSNNASSSSPFNAAAIAHFNFLIFWYFYIFFNKYFRF